MKSVNVHEAKTHFSKLLARGEKGQEVLISRAGKPVARLVPHEVARPAPLFGADRGKFAAHTLKLAELPDHHRDPFDRLLVAQATVEGLPLLTADKALRRYKVELRRP